MFLSQHSTHERQPNSLPQHGTTIGFLQVLVQIRHSELFSRSSNKRVLWSILTSRLITSSSILLIPFAFCGSSFDFPLSSLLFFGRGSEHVSLSNIFSTTCLDLSVSSGTPPSLAYLDLDQVLVVDVVEGVLYNRCHGSMASRTCTSYIVPTVKEVERNWPLVSFGKIAVLSESFTR